MNFKESLKILNIEDYEERIFNSNSHGELFHCFDYITVAQELEKKGKDISWFRNAFKKAVKYAEENWERPESVFQHVFKMI